jgi:peptidoglycan/xylan/chitin deacetylase (PgdA/CDA1 family)
VADLRKSLEAEGLRERVEAVIAGARERLRAEPAALAARALDSGLPRGVARHPVSLRVFTRSEMQPPQEAPLGRLLYAAAVFALAALAAAGATSGRAATGPAVVTIQFVDGSADQYAALAIVNAHGMHATFYVNTGFAGDSTHLSWTQLQDLHAAGNEIGGHTLTHAHLKHLKTADARHEVCDDRVNLYLQPRSRAAVVHLAVRQFDAGVKQIVPRRVRDAHAAEPEAGNDARHDRELRDRRRAALRRLGPARLPPSATGATPTRSPRRTSRRDWRYPR